VYKSKRVGSGGPPRKGNYLAMREVTAAALVACQDMSK